MEHGADTVMAVCVRLMKLGSGSAVFKNAESVTVCPSGSEYDGREMVFEVPAITVSSANGKAEKEGGLLIPLRVNCCKMYCPFCKVPLIVMVEVVAVPPVVTATLPSVLETVENVGRVNH